MEMKENFSVSGTSTTQQLFLLVWCRPCHSYAFGLYKWLLSWNLIYILIYNYKKMYHFELRFSFWWLVLINWREKLYTNNHCHSQKQTSSTENEILLRIMFIPVRQVHPCSSILYTFRNCLSLFTLEIMEVSMNAAGSWKLYRYVVLYST